MNAQKYAIGVDVGGSHLTSAVVDLEKGAVVTDSLVTPMDSKGPLEHIIACFKENLETTLKTCGLPVTCIGFAFPGPFDYEKGISWMEHKFDNLYGVDIPATLRKVLEVPNVEDLQFRFVNDASGFAIGECFCGSGKDSHRVMAVTLGTGVGSGFVVDGVLDEVSDRIPPAGAVWDLPFEGGIVDENFSTRWFVKRWGDLTGQQIRGAKDVADEFDVDPRANQVFAEFGTRLAKFASPWLEKFGADAFVMGGNISREYPKFKEALLAGLPSGVKVFTSSLLDKAAMIGAASLFNK